VTRSKLVCLSFAGALGAVGVFAAPAFAHGLVGRADLPVPTWLFGWAAALVLVVSFVGLAVLWQRPRLQEVGKRRLFRIPLWIEAGCAAVGIAFFAAVIFSGLAGTTTATANLAPTAVYVLFWVGLAVLSVLFGDVFRLFNPWLGLARGAAWLARRVAPNSESASSEPLPYPHRLGRWPAVMGIACFAWLELVYVNRTDPNLLAVLALLYAVVQLIGMSVYGIETWSERADAFGVYFNLFSRISVFELSDRTIYLRKPLSGLPGLEVWPATVALLCVLIGSTSFDGVSSTSLWTEVEPGLAGAFGSLGLGKSVASELAFTVGLLFMIGVVFAVYRLGIGGIHSVGGGYSRQDLAERFVHTLVPIAFAYVLAHYFSLLVDQGQAIAYLASDPLGDGSNLIGTAGAKIDYNVVSASGIWYVQVASLIVGHVAALALAHDRAIAIYRRTDQATRSQFWMLAVMIAFTSLGLWILSSLNS
jgi:hypothetical protein